MKFEAGDEVEIDNFGTLSHGMTGIVEESFPFFNAYNVILKGVKTNPVRRYSGKSLKLKNREKTKDVEDGDMNEFKVGDRVRVISDCNSKYRVGEVVRKEPRFSVVYFESEPFRSASTERRFSNKSLQLVVEGKKKVNPDSDERIAVFYTEPKESFDMEVMECPDMFMIYAESVQQAIDRLSRLEDYEDDVFRSVLFDGKLYNIESYRGYILKD